MTYRAWQSFWPVFLAVEVNCSFNQLPLREENTSLRRKKNSFFTSKSRHLALVSSRSTAWTHQGVHTDMIKTLQPRLKKSLITCTLCYFSNTYRTAQGAMLGFASHVCTELRVRLILQTRRIRSIVRSTTREK